MQNRAECTGRFQNLVRQNLRLARRWKPDELGTVAIDQLRDLTVKFRFSLALGDLAYLDRGWYITHAGLVRLASRRRCSGIDVQQVLESSDQSSARWVFRATVYKSSGSRGFVGYGDADPSNVSSLLRGAEMRIAETRAVNRALRKAYGVGVCSVEELGSLSGKSESSRNHDTSRKHSSNGSNNGQTRLRDRLCVLIRQHNLDPAHVKAYAADFCGTPTIREANRELVESFISHLATSARENRDALICKLNSYSQPMEVKS